MSAPDVVVIGGGVIGLSIAYALAKEQVSVMVLDAGAPGQASTAAAGMLAPLAEAGWKGHLCRLLSRACGCGRFLWINCAKSHKPRSALPGRVCCASPEHKRKMRLFVRRLTGSVASACPCTVWMPPNSMPSNRLSVPPCAVVFFRRWSVMSSRACSFKHYGMLVFGTASSSGPKQQRRTLRQAKATSKPSKQGIRASPAARM